MSETTQAPTENKLLQAINESDAARAEAAAATRERRKWAYVRETMLRQWAAKTGAHGTDEELVRQFFKNEIRNEAARVEKGIEERDGVTDDVVYFAAWVNEGSPRYIREDDLKVMMKDMEMTDDNIETFVLASFNETDELAIVEVAMRNDRKVYVVRTPAGRDLPPVF